MVMLSWITKIKLRTNGIWGHVRYKENTQETTLLKWGQREIPRARADNPNFCFSLEMIKASTILGTTPSKTLVSLVLDRPSPKDYERVKNLSPWNTRPLASLLTLPHQSKKETSVAWGESDWRPTCERNRYQYSLTKTMDRGEARNLCHWGLKL
jgi:hypothetical protein